MIPEKELEEIRTYLNKSENPLFFFDDDPDGLCSFLMLKKYLNDRGKGVILKTAPILDLKFERKIKEYSPDFIFVLDIPIISQEFIDKTNVPIIWIDHHPIVEREGTHHYNPRFYNKNINIPVSYICYKLTKQDLWLATVGCVYDFEIPDFIDEFKEKYPDLLPSKINDQEEVLYKTKLGELIRIINFNLKGKTEDVKKSLNVLQRIETPYEILNQETPRGKFIFNRAKKISKEYRSLLEEAKKTKPKEGIVLFLYPARKISLTTELAGELMHIYKDKIIIVGRERNDQIKLSIRARFNISIALLKALKDIEGYGGGHEKACGANIAKKDFYRFLDNFKEAIKK